MKTKIRLVIILIILFTSGCQSYFESKAATEEAAALSAAQTETQHAVQVMTDNAPTATQTFTPTSTHTPTSTATATLPPTLTPTNTLIPKPTKLAAPPKDCKIATGNFRINNLSGQDASVTLTMEDSSRNCSYNLYVPVGDNRYWVEPGRYIIDVYFCGGKYMRFSGPINSNWSLTLKKKYCQ